MTKIWKVLLPVLLLALAACETKKPVDPTPIDTTSGGNVPPATDYRGGPAHDTVFEAAGIEFKMVFVAGGTFTMGASTSQGVGFDPDADSDEMPPHSVTLSPYLIGEMEVSQFLFYSIMGYNPSQTANLTLPVHNISFLAAERFLDSLSHLTGYRFRLPSEAEWEYAAKGGRAAANSPYFSGSSSVDSVGWSIQNANNQIHIACLLKPNALGIYDMSGNVKEWCSDWYGAYSSAPQTNPQGPEMPSNANHQKHACRGGSYLESPYYLRNTARQFFHSAIENRDMGIRIALSVE